MFLQQSPESHLLEGGPKLVLLANMACHVTSYKVVLVVLLTNILRLVIFCDVYAVTILIC